MCNIRYISDQKSNDQDIGLGEVVAHEQQGLPQTLGEGIGEDVSVVEFSGMLSFAESPPAGQRLLGQTSINRLNQNFNAGK